MRGGPPYDNRLHQGTRGRRVDPLHCPTSHFGTDPMVGTGEFHNPVPCTTNMSGTGSSVRAIGKGGNEAATLT